MVLALTFTFALRSLFLFFYEKGTKAARFVNASLTCLFTFLSAFLYQQEKFSLRFFLILLVCFSLGIFFWRNKSRLRFFKAAGFFLFFVIFFIHLAFSHFIRVLDDQPILKIVIPGATYQGNYLVEVYSLEGQLLEEHYVPGDLVGVRAKVIRVKPFFAFFGASNLCKVDLLFSSFQEAKAIRKFSPYAQEIASDHSKKMPKMLVSLWEELFFQTTKSIWVKGALMQAVFFPLQDGKGKPFCGSYHLTLTEGGLSSLEIPKENIVKN
jgi:hypothetical protein